MKIGDYDISLWKLIVAGIIIYIISTIITIVIIGGVGNNYRFVVPDYMAYWHTIFMLIFFIIFIILVVKGKFGIMKKL